MNLTREYFAEKGWNIVNHEPDENGFILWEARWVRHVDKDGYFAKLSVTNAVLANRFCLCGETYEADVNYIMLYTEEDLITALKALKVYGNPKFNIGDKIVYYEHFNIGNISIIAEIVQREFINGKWMYTTNDGAFLPEEECYINIST